MAKKGYVKNFRCLAKEKTTELADLSLAHESNEKVLKNNSKADCEGHIIAFDFGTKRIGVAVGQGFTKTATALSPLAARDGVPRWELIEEIIQTWQPWALVVGLPLKKDGTDQPVTKFVRIFIENLKVRYQLPVYEVDECLTTVEARSRLFDEGGYSALQKNSIDCFAAKVILEDWYSRPT